MTRAPRFPEQCAPRGQDISGPAGDSGSRRAPPADRSRYCAGASSPGWRAAQPLSRPDTEASQSEGTSSRGTETVTRRQRKTQREDDELKCAQNLSCPALVEFLEISLELSWNLSEGPCAVCHFHLQTAALASCLCFLLFDAVAQRVEFLEPILQQSTVFIGSTGQRPHSNVSHVTGCVIK